MTKKENTLGTLTYSRISSFLTCPMLEWYQYRAGKGVGIRTTAPYIPFIEGDFLHYALHHYHKSGRMLRQNMLNRIQKLIDEVAGESGLEPELEELIRVKLAAMLGACLGYKMRYANDRADYKHLFIETPFKFELEEFVIEGKIDRIDRVAKTDALLLWENKSATQYTADTYTVMPMNLQDLIYCEGCKILTGEYPDFRARDYVIKSKLRRKQDGSGGRESYAEFEARVQQQYVDDPAKMFVRPTPIKVYDKELDEVKKQLAVILRMFRDNEPYMNFGSCTGMYGQPCPFVQACTARLRGHKTGWDAPECRGLYRLKEALHPELEKKDEQE